MNRIKIAFLVTEFPRISETFVLNQITGLIERGHEIDIYAFGPSEETKIHESVERYNLLTRTVYYGDTIKNIPANRIDRVMKLLPLVGKNFYKNPLAFLKSMNVFKYKREAVNLKIMYKIIPFLNRKKYDIILCHFGPNGNLGVFLKDIGLFNGKIITVFHGYDISQYIKKHGRDVYENLFRKGNLFLPISERWKEELISLGCCEDKVVVHHMGIDPGKYTYAQRNARNGDKTIILSIGRFVEKKGIRYGIEAVGRIIKQYSKIEYLIIGDGALREEFESIIDQMNLREKVKLLGWKSQEEIIDGMKDADILLAPSVTGKDGDQEGIPVVLMEAMAMGLPVVSTYHSGIPELVQDGVSGFLVPERDVESLAKALANLIDNPELGWNAGQNGRQTVEEHFNIEKLNDILLEICNSY